MTDRFKRNFWGALSAIGILVVVERFTAWRNGQAESGDWIFATMVYVLCFKFFYSYYKVVKRKRLAGKKE